jgi:hypothetical protein
VRRSENGAPQFSLSSLPPFSYLVILIWCLHRGHFVLKILKEKGKLKTCTKVKSASLVPTHHNNDAFRSCLLRVPDLLSKATGVGTGFCGPSIHQHDENFLGSGTEIQFGCGGGKVLAGEPACWRTGVVLAVLLVNVDQAAPEGEKKG